MAERYSEVTKVPTSGPHQGHQVTVTRVDNEMYGSCECGCCFQEVQNQSARTGISAFQGSEALRSAVTK